MTYGLTQKFIRSTRDRFKRGELAYEEAMWYLDYTYNDNLMTYIEGYCDE